MPCGCRACRGNMEVAAGPWSEIFEGDGGTEANSGGDVMLGSSTLTLTPLVAESPSVRRSQPIFISSNRWAVFLSPDCVARLQCECVLVRPCLTLSNGWDLSLHLDFCPFLCSWLNTGVFYCLSSPCRDVWCAVYFQGESRFALLLRPIHPKPIPGTVQPLQVAGPHQLTAAAARQQACEWYRRCVALLSACSWNNKSLKQSRVFVSMPITPCDRWRCDVSV